MFKFIKLIVGFIVLVGFGYFLFFVPLGSLTLYQHLRNISNTDEARELGEGIKEKADFVTAEAVENVPELKEVDTKVKAVKSAVSAKSGAASSTSSDPGASEKSIKEESSSSVSSRKMAEISNNDRSALDNLIKSKLK